VKCLLIACFVCGVALLAAVLGDAVVEGISDAGSLWHGDYTDQSSIDLLPVLLLAVAATIGALGLIVLHQAREHGHSPRSIMISSARVFMTRNVVSALPFILALQFAVLFVMETAEQVIVYGHALGGAVWLGGPVAASAVIHALFSVAIAFWLANRVRVAAKAILRVLARIAASDRGVRVRAAILRRTEPVTRARDLVVICSSIVRGPPVPAAA
jgi:hypothetical protein